MSPFARFGCLIAAISIVLDQATKWWILEGIMQPPRIIPLTPFFNLLLTWNNGVSFGLFNNSNSLNAVLLSALAIVIVVFLFFWLRKAESTRMAVGLGLIIGGALGNVIDRGLHGAVVDFLDFYINTLHWPAFNVADSCITVGAIILIFDSLFSPKPEQAKMDDR
ncbi:MAG: signal peptidase II [Rhodospirillaceae bacterium]|nr:signal peptidase II [Rhodospirillaceae bacterium]MBT7954379.1 signal peptidase II [Rhodospirillaceae bacterium]